MKNIITKLGVFLVAIFSVVGIVSADSFVNDRFQFDDVINFDGNKKGSIVLAGETIKSKGTVDGIGLVAGNTINIDGSYEYLFTAGNDITISGNYSKEIYVAGNNITLDSDTVVTRETFIAGSTINLSGNYEGDIYITGAIVNISNANIKSNIRISADIINVKENTTISGTLKHNDDATIEKDDNSIINNISTYKADTAMVETNTLKNKISFLAYKIVTKAIVGLLLLFICPFIFNFMKKEYINLSVEKGFKLLGKGLLLLLFTPVAALFLMISVLGLPVGIIGLLIYGILIYLSTILSAYVMGNLITNKLIKKEQKDGIVLCIGLLVFYILKIIPFVGALLSMIYLFVGLGVSLEIITKNR